jgi:hypothetical protein
VPPHRLPAPKVGGALNIFYKSGIENILWNLDQALTGSRQWRARRPTTQLCTTDRSCHFHRPHALAPPSRESGHHTQRKLGILGRG